LLCHKISFAGLKKREISKQMTDSQVVGKGISQKGGNWQPGLLRTSSGWLLHTQFAPWMSMLGSKGST
jgi:hypothetical protein